MESDSISLRLYELAFMLETYRHALLFTLVKY